jgi:uncharacterized protein YegL
MPKLNDDSLMEEHALPNTSFGYSATRIDELGATEYTTVDLIVDTSGSVDAYAREMEKAIQEIVNACKLSPRADNLMIRFVTFNDQMEEIHGYKLLENCNLSDYDGVLNCGGMTALYDASENAVLSAVDYAKSLTENDFAVNSIVFFVTDGCDNRSAVSEAAVKKALESAVQSEATESMVSILIGVGTGHHPGVSQRLKEFEQNADITQYVETQDANAKTLAKLAEFVSKSISAQSQALGTGGPSTPTSLSI